MANMSKGGIWHAQGEFDLTADTVAGRALENSTRHDVACEASGKPLRLA